MKAGPEMRRPSLEQCRLTDLFPGAGEDSFQEGQKDRLARRSHKTRQAPVDEPGPFHAEQGGSRQVHLQDPALFIQGEIADRARNRRGRCIFPAGPPVRSRASWSSAFCISSSTWWTCNSWSSRCASAC